MSYMLVMDLIPGLVFRFQVLYCCAYKIFTFLHPFIESNHLIPHTVTYYIMTPLFLHGLETLPPQRTRNLWKGSWI